MGEMLWLTQGTSVLIVSSFLLVTRTCINAWVTSGFCHIPPLTTKLAVIEHLKLVATLAPLFLIGSSSFLQVNRVPFVLCLIVVLSNIWFRGRDFDFDCTFYLAIQVFQTPQYQLSRVENNCIIVYKSYSVAI